MRHLILWMQAVGGGADVHREEHRRRAGQEHAHHHDHALGQGPVQCWVDSSPV